MNAMVKLILVLLVLLCLSDAGWAAQSVNVVSSGQFDGAQLNNAAFTSAGTASWRWEFRFHNLSGLGTSANVLGLGPFTVNVGSGMLTLTSEVNPPATDQLGTQVGGITIAGYTDGLIRVMRDLTAMTWTLQLCATQGSNCQVTSWPITVLGTTNDWSAWSMYFYYGNDYAWLRMFSTLVPTGNIIINSNTGNTLDWEFEGNVVDSILGLAFSGTTVAYSTTPAYNPGCNTLTQQTMIVGQTGNVTSVNMCQSLNNISATLTYLWAYAGAGTDGVTQSSLVLATPTTTSTNVSGMVKGSVNLNLTVTDTSSNSTGVEVHDGAVAVNSLDIVQTGLSTEQDTILGPMLRWGSTKLRVPWFDFTNKNLLDLQGGAMLTNFPDYWDQAQGQSPGTFASGTVQVGPSATCGGSAAGFGVIGTSTTFTALPALRWASSSTSTLINGAGNYTFTVASGLGYSTGDQLSITSNASSANNLQGSVLSYSGTTLVVTVATGGAHGSGTHTDWNIIEAGLYNVVAWNAGANRSLTQIQSVTSDTCMLIQYQWEISTEIGLQYTGPTLIGSWGYAQANTPGNYYDNVKAYRSFYERSGIDTYWTYYTTMADNFWHSPPMDQGLAFQPGYEYVYTNRSQSLEGMFLRSSDSGMSAMKTGVDLVVTYNMGILTTAQNYAGFGDTRLNAYAMGFTALGAQYSPNSTNVTSYKSALSTGIPYLNGSIGPTGNFPTLELTVTNIGTVTVTHNSTAVTCSGCDFTVPQFNGPPPMPNPMGINPSSFVTYPGSCAAVPPNDNSTFSSVYYPLSGATATALTLDRVYSETSGTACWAYASNVGGTNYVPGWGEQVFMSGIETTYLFLAARAITISDPTNSTRALTDGNSDAGWLKTYGYSDPAHGGVGGAYYYQGYLTCSYPVQTVSCNGNFDASQARADASEMVRGLTAAYSAAPTTPKATFLNTLLDQMFCKPGFTVGSQGAGLTCTTDGSYLTDLDPGGSFMTSLSTGNKWLGFFFGWSALINSLTESYAGNIPTFIKR